MPGWKVGDVCYVVTDTYHKSGVVKVGRRWLKVKMRGCSTVYEFDLLDELRDRCRIGTLLMTVEQMELDNTQRTATDLVGRLRAFVRRCPDRALLEHITGCIKTWTGPRTQP